MRGVDVVGATLVEVESYSTNSLRRCGLAALGLPFSAAFALIASVALAFSFAFLGTQPVRLFLCYVLEPTLGIRASSFAEVEAAVRGIHRTLA